MRGERLGTIGGLALTNACHATPSLAWEQSRPSSLRNPGIRGSASNAYIRATRHRENTRTWPEKLRARQSGDTRAESGRNERQ